MIDHEEFPLLGTKGTPGLLNYVQARGLVLPEFQRRFLWARTPDRTTKLLASIAQEWPAGALLLMEGDRGFQTHSVEGWKKHPDVKLSTKPKYALLDGQQRMTALYQACFDRSPDYVYAVALLDLLHIGELDPEEGGSFLSFPKKQWDRRYGSMEKQREAGLISIGALVNPKAWEHWKDGFDQETKADLNELREGGLLAGLLRYQFPVSIVLEAAPDEALANIFVTINQQGIKLTTFDLVVARTVRRRKGAQEGFNLREVWDRAAGREETEDAAAVLPKYETLRNFRIDPEVPLRLVRLLVEDSAKLSDTSIIKLEPAEVQQRIDRALEVTDSVIKFLEANIGLIPQSLPDANYLLPLLLTAHTKPAVLKNKRDSEKLLRWYWAATFRTIFGRGQTGDLIPQEARAVLDWVVQFGSEPDTTRTFWPAFDQELKVRLLQGTAQNQHFMRALFALEIAEGATDWKGLSDGSGRHEEFALREAGAWPVTPLDIHHMWARGVKRPAKTASQVDGMEIPHGDQAYEAVINRCLLLKSTNTGIGNTPLPAVTQLQGVRTKWVSTYLLDPRAKTWPDFVRGRYSRIRKALRGRIAPSGDGE